MTELIDYLIADVMKKENYATYKKDDSSSKANKGDGYLGAIDFIRIFASKAGIKRTYNIVIKSAKTSDDFRKKTPIRECFEREAFLYTKIFKAFKDLQEEYGVDLPINCFAKCFTVCLESKKESVVLQDLKSIGFELHNRLLPMNLNHVYMVMTKYGKFHGLSLALRHKKSSLFNSLTKDMTDLFGIFITQTKMVPSLVQDFRQVLRLLEERGRLDIVKKYVDANFIDKIDKLTTKNTNPEDPGSVLLHGDCWNNNFMFKYEGLSKDQPTDMVFIDFQLSRVASPIYDLSYFFYACCDENVFQHFNYLMLSYFNSLKRTLQHYELNINDFLPFDKLMEHWKIFGGYGLLMSLFIVRIELTQPDEAPDFAQQAEAGDMEGFLNYEIKNQPLYNRRVTDNYIHFAQNFL